MGGAEGEHANLPGRRTGTEPAAAIARASIRSAPPGAAGESLRFPSSTTLNRPPAQRVEYRCLRVIVCLVLVLATRLTDLVRDGGQAGTGRMCTGVL
jgi:hypothetical protein